MKTNEVQIEILKILNIMPNHGYDLYLSLREPFEIKNPSELYKVLRIMLREGLIEESKKEKENGRERVIYTLSKRGQKHYYQTVLKSAMLFVDLMSDLITKKTKDFFFEEIVTHGFDSIFSKESNIYVYLDIPFERQIYFLNQFAQHFKKPQNFYFRFNEVPNSKIRSNNPLIKINILDQNLNIKPKTIDTLISFTHLLFPIKNSKEKWIELLKPNGNALILYYNRRIRVLPLLLGGIIQEISEKLTSNKSDAFDLPLLFNNPAFSPNIFNKLKESDPILEIQKHFEKVVKIERKNALSPPAFEIFFAQNPIKSKEQ